MLVMCNCDYQPRSCMDLTRLPQKQHSNPWGRGGAWSLWNCAVGQSHDSGEQEVWTEPESLHPHPQTRLRRPERLWNGGSVLTVQLSPEAVAASDPSQGAGKDMYSQSPALAQND